MNETPPSIPVTDTEAPTPVPAEPRSFWCAGADLSTLRAPPLTDALPALERLGPSPFPKSRFRFLSFLATVYDHVAAQSEGAPLAGEPPATVE